MEMPKANFETWLKNTTALTFNEQSLVISTISPFAAEMLSKRLLPTISRVVDNIANTSISIDFKVFVTPEKNSENLSKSKKPVTKEFQKKYFTPIKYTFESFVVGPSNELAYASTQQIANSKSVKFNPLYLYSDVGLGKTHLLHAIAHSLSAKNLNTRYITGEMFTNEYIFSIKEGKINNFREKYSKLDALLVDDIHFLSGKNQTQEAFFHIFNELFIEGKPIVIAGDDPKDLAQIESRILSRLQGGLVVDIQKPDYETRVAIIEKKASLANVTIEPEVTTYLAKMCRNNVRQIEMALNRILAFAQLKNCSASLALAENIIKGFRINNPPSIPSPEKLLSYICKYFNINISSLKSSKREQKLIYARKISYYILRKDLNLTWSIIGKILGNKNHSTVIQAYRSIEDDLKKSSLVRNDLQQIKNHFNF
jgi:chromosomal replication initiator protein